MRKGVHSIQPTTVVPPDLETRDPAGPGKWGYQPPPW